MEIIIVAVVLVVFVLSGIKVVNQYQRGADAW